MKSATLRVAAAIAGSAQELASSDAGGLAGRHLGDFDLDPQLDLGQHAVEAGVAGAVLEMGGRGLQPAAASPASGRRRAARS